MKEKITSGNVLEKWANQYESVQVWLANLQQKRQNAFDLYRFCQWTGKDPDQLLALKDDPASKEMERLVDRFKISEGYTLSVRRRIIIAAKSFFKWNYRPISSAAGIINYVKEAPYHRLTKEDIRKIWRACFNPRDRFIIDLTFTSAIAKESMTHLRWKHLEKDWRNQEYLHFSLEDKIIKGHGRGKYKGVRQETFTTPEAKRDLIEYVDWMEKLLGRSLTPEDPIFFQIRKPYTPLTYGNITRIFVDLRERSGVQFSAHDGRRWVENALENANIHINRCRKIRGRKVRGEEAPYSRPEVEALRRDYAKAVPDLEFQKEEAPTAEDLLRAEIKARLEVMDPAARQRFARELATIYRERAGRFLEHPDIKALLEEEEAKTSGGDCQRIVSEEQLPEYLANGWRVQAVLPSGRVVISNER